jgi:hypothetical protein
MNIRDEELVQRYFERDMTSGEEQNFLIDVAARDDMRLAFRSHLELIKAVGRDREISSATALVRERTLAALGLSAAMLPLATEDADAAVPFATRIAGGVKSFFMKPVTLLLGGILVGGIGAYSLSNTATTQTPSARENQIVRPAITNPENVQSAPANVAAPVDAPAQKDIVAPHTANRAQGTTQNIHTSQTENVPVINTENPIQVTVKKPKIEKPAERPASK